MPLSVGPPNDVLVNEIKYAAPTSEVPSATPSSLGAPIASILPSLFNETEVPNSSPEPSSEISNPE